MALHVYIEFRFVTYRAQGARLDRTAIDRLEFKRITHLFIREEDRETWSRWTQAFLPPGEAPAAPSELKRAGLDAHRKLLDIFQAQNPDRMITQAIAASRTLVDEVIKLPYAAVTLAQLQGATRGTADHSVNVSILATYLAMQMGYTHNLILQHVGAGALLHDVGKARVQLADDDTDATVEQKMKAHPAVGVEMLEKLPEVPNEVKLIVAQHHENFDGTGYPKRLRGNAIYDLARIVSVANVFDELVGTGKGTLIERQRSAVQQLDQTLYKRFDPNKLEKCLKILRLGI